MTVSPDLVFIAPGKIFGTKSVLMSSESLFRTGCNSIPLESVYALEHRKGTNFCELSDLSDPMQKRGGIVLTLISGGRDRRVNALASPAQTHCHRHYLRGDPPALGRIMIPSLYIVFNV
jgi:hypothetical protein